MRIWIINQNAGAPSDPTGTRHFTLARQLIRRGHEALIVASSFCHKTRHETRLGRGQLFQRENIEGVPYLWLKAPAYQGNGAARVWNMAVFAWRVWRKTGLSGERLPDVIVGSSPPLFAAYAAERLAAQFGIPFVLEVRDVWPETLVELGRISTRHPFIRVLRQIERHLYRRASAIVSLLPAIEDHIAANGGAGKPTIWLPNGVDTEMIPPMSNPPSSGTFTIAYAGSHGLSNSLETILQCAQIVQQDPRGVDVRFRLIGDGPDKVRLQEFARRQGLANVRFDPSIGKSDIYRELAKADAFIAALRNSALYRFGQSMNKLYDYMAMGRPIILAVPPMIEPISQAHAGLVVPAEDPVAMAKAVLQLRQLQPRERQQMGQRARDAVLQKHNSGHLAAKLEDLLQRVAMGNGAAIGLRALSSADRIGA